MVPTEPMERHLASASFIRKAIALAWSVSVSLGLVTAITFFFFRVVPVNATTIGFVYLVAILVIATTGGLIESTVASVAAMLCFNYFYLPPIGTFTIADPHNWVALFAFLATSLTASQLSARAKRRTQEAIDRRGEMERLYSLSRSLLLTDPTKPMARQMVQQIAQVFAFSAMALYDRNSDEIYRAGFDDADAIDSRLREAAVRSVEVREDSTLITVRPISLGGCPIGSLALRGGLLSDAALQSLLNLVAIGLERAISQRAVNRAEVARQSEELKSTLLDAIAHDFKTPLTSIKAVTTDLLSEPPSELRQHQRELISIADEGTDRLSKLVTDAIQLARIEGGTFQLNRGTHFPTALVSAAIRRMKALLDGREIKISASDDLPPVQVDADLIQMAIANLVDNALKYSPARAPVTIGLSTAGKKVIICVHDGGPGIAEDEQLRIFEKFYRGKNERNLKGTGLGLSIAREIIHAHGEEIWLSSKPGEGSDFSFALPMAPRNGAQ